MCADELKERREMALKSCLHCPFPFKCLLVWPGPGFRGSHGNRDFGEDFGILTLGEGKTDISAVVLFFAAGVIWDFDNSMSSWRGASGGEIGYRWGWKVEAFSVDSEWPVCVRWHVALFPLQLPELTTSQRQCVKTVMFAQAYTYAYGHRYAHKLCKLICNQINQSITYFWYKMCFFLLDLHYET